MRVLSAAVSRFITASATSLLPAAAAADAAQMISATRNMVGGVGAPRREVRGGPPRREMSWASRREVACIRLFLRELREPTSAVALDVPVNAVQIEHAQQQVAGRDRLAFVGQMPVPLQLPVGAADENVRHVV